MEFPFDQQTYRTTFYPFINSNIIPEYTINSNDHKENIKRSYEISKSHSSNYNDFFFNKKDFSLSHFINKLVSSYLLEYNLKYYDPKIIFNKILDIITNSDHLHINVMKWNDHHKNVFIVCFNHTFDTNYLTMNIINDLIQDN